MQMRLKSRESTAEKFTESSRQHDIYMPSRSRQAHENGTDIKDMITILIDHLLS